MQFILLFVILVSYEITATKKAIRTHSFKRNLTAFVSKGNIDIKYYHHHHRRRLVNSRNLKRNENTRRKGIHQESSVKRDSLTNLHNKKFHYKDLSNFNKTSSRTLRNSTIGNNALHRKIFNRTSLVFNKTTNIPLSRTRINLTAESPKDASGDKRHHYFHPVHRYHPRHHFLRDDDDYDEDDREFFRHHILPVESITDTINPIQRMGHIEPIDPIDPMEPIDPIEPIERIREIEPVEPMEKIERMESLFPMKSIEEEDGEAKSKIPKRYNHTNHRRYLSKHNLTNLYYNLAPHVVEVPIEHNPNDALKVTDDRVFMLPSSTTLVNMDDGHQNWRTIVGARGSLGVLHPATGATGAVYSAKGAVESRVGVHEPATGVTKPAVGVTDPAKGSMKEAVKATGAGPNSKTETGKKLPPNEGYKKDELVDCKKVNSSQVKNCTNDDSGMNESVASQLSPPKGLDSVASLNNMIESLKNESNNFQDSRKYTESVVKLMQNLTKVFNSSNNHEAVGQQQSNLIHIDKQKSNESSTTNSSLINTKGATLKNEKVMIKPSQESHSDTNITIHHTMPSGDKFNTTQVYHRLRERKHNKSSIDSKQPEFELVDDLKEKRHHDNSTVKARQTPMDGRRFHSIFRDSFQDSIDPKQLEFELVEDKKYEHDSTIKTNQTLLPNDLKSRSPSISRDSNNLKPLEYEFIEDKNVNNISKAKTNHTLLPDYAKGRFLHPNESDNVSHLMQPSTEHNHTLSFDNTDKVNATTESAKNNNSKLDTKISTEMLNGKLNSTKPNKDESTLQVRNNKQIENIERKLNLSSLDLMLKKSPNSISIGDRRGIVIPKFPNPPISSRIEEFKDPEPIKPIKLKKIKVPIKEVKIKESLDKTPDIEPIDVGQLTTRLLDEPIKSIGPIESKIPEINKNPVVEPLSPIEII